jgi:hypothetical protein
MTFSVKKSSPNKNILPKFFKKFAQMTQMRPVAAQMVPEEELNFENSNFGFH